METLFLRIFHMSVVAGWVILAVILLRILLRKAPRAISCILWALVGIRLIFPISYESQFSLIPGRAILSEEVLTAQESAAGQMTENVPQGGKQLRTGLLSAAAENPVGWLQSLSRIGAILWAVGMASMLLYAGSSWLRLRRQVALSMRLRDNVWIGDHVMSPFILGVFRPRIYLPSGLKAPELECVIGHEEAHLRRYDHWWKPLGFLLLSVYWFQPLCWVAYILLCRDIELACDERVVRGMSAEEKKHYAETLLSCGTKQQLISACPLSFGEVGVKERVKSVLYYKKPAFWIGMAAAGICIVAAICFLTNPLSGSWKMGRYDEEELTAMIREMSGSDAEIFEIYESETIPGTLLAGYRNGENKMAYAVFGWIKEGEKDGYYRIRGYRVLGGESLTSNTIGADWGIDRSLTVVLCNGRELSHMEAQTNGEFREVQTGRDEADGPAMFVMEWSKLVKADSVDIRYFDQNGTELSLAQKEDDIPLLDWGESDDMIGYIDEIDQLDMDVMTLDGPPGEGNEGKAADSWPRGEEIRTIPVEINP